MNPRLRVSASILAHLFLAAICGLDLKSRGVVRRAVERVLAKNPVATKYADALGGATLAVFGFPGSHLLGDEVGPLALAEVGEAGRPGNWQADSFRHLAIIAEEVFRPRGRDVATG